METVQVKAELRKAGTKGVARQLRMSGLIPGVVYGEGGENLPITLPSASFEHMLRRVSSNVILDLEITGREGSPFKVIIKEVQRNPVDSKVLHVDLQHISMTHRVRVDVPIHLTGTAIGVKEGGILEHLLRELDIECMPGDIPEDFKVDVSALARGHSVHVRDLVIPEGTHVFESMDRVVATVVAKAKEEEVAKPAAEAAEGAEGAAEGAAGEKGDEGKKGDKKGDDGKKGDKKGDKGDKS
jgi:large subunit ribosomal protein L25